MNPKWLKLAAQLLESASAVFSNRGCNDFDYPKDWTQADIDEFEQAVNLWNTRNSEPEPDPAPVPDWFAMSFLALWIKDQANGE